MAGFSLSDNELACDGVPLSAIAESAGTPTYVYSAATLRARYRAIDDAFAGYPHRLHYALKANSALRARAAAREGVGSAVDANSIWEIELARRAGFDPADIVFTGVGKSDAELECAVPLGLRAINVESAGELARVEAIAARIGVAARVAIRINPDIDARSHPHISTGLRINKFGVPVDAARELAGIDREPARRCASSPSTSTSDRRSRRSSRCGAPRRFSPASARELAGSGIQLEYLDAGGGLGVAYDDAPAVAAERIRRRRSSSEIRPTGLPIVVEPGRSIVGPAAVLLARVVDLKPRDAGEHVRGPRRRDDRAAAAGALQRLSPHRAGQAPRRPRTTRYELVGPVCESSDVVGRDRSLPALEQGDLVAIRDAGAYGSAMASNYNRRPLPAEVLVDEGRWRVIRRRQTVDDMLALESD